MATTGPSGNPGDPEDHRVAEYRIPAEEQTSRAIVTAFDRAGLREGHSSVLYDWIDAEAVDRLFDHHASDPETAVTVWDHEVRLTPETVAIYEA